MRVLVSLGALILVFLIGVETNWISVSKAEPVTNEDRAFEVVVLGQTRPDATSGELIDAAVIRGEISSEQALLYGLYLACADPRLPAQFKGQETTAPAKNILWEADVEWTSLSPDVQQALHTFFTKEAAEQRGRACAADIDRLVGDQTIWWAPALQLVNTVVQVATHQ